MKPSAIDRLEKRVAELERELRKTCDRCNKPHAPPTKDGELTEDTFSWPPDGAYLRTLIADRDGKEREWCECPACCGEFWKAWNAVGEERKRG